MTTITGSTPPLPPWLPSKAPLTPLSSPSPTAPDAPTRALAAFANAGHAADSLNQAVLQSRRDRSAKAKQHLEELLKQFDKMRSLMIGGDPKALARWAHDMAKAIGDAAKQFGDNADSAPSPLGLPASPPSTPTSTDATSSTPATTPSTSDAQAVDGITPPTDGSPPVEASAENKAAKASATTVETKAVTVAVAAAKKADQSATDQTLKADAAPVDAVAANATAGTALLHQLGGGDASRAKEMVKERELFERAKSAIHTLKNIVEDATKKSGTPAETKDFDEDTKNLEAAIKTIGDHGEGLTITATANPSPTVNLMA